MLYTLFFNTKSLKSCTLHSEHNSIWTGHFASSQQLMWLVTALLDAILLEHKPHEGKIFCLLFTLLYLQCLILCIIASSRPLIDIFK